ncbi:hypothetical protein EDD27_8620 [Nonomuraea polychroma]|uniref:Uncharacterized protein n=1 Tax=Nonomuraea polychroma TaxID=46176 RepID=A0A438MJX9_9ACTN|nr:hypothetical protein EDD27_8620 [Nonomuraea polychroma]
MDFSRLPYVEQTTGKDHNSDTSYLSDKLVPIPFRDRTLRLKPGVHLHWTLPDALTRLEQQGGVTQVPAAPDRWLVTRSRDGVVDAQWVVESDFLAPPGDRGGGITYPVERDVPFRRLGRRVPLNAWTESAADDRLPEITAIGYGDATFAAFYPNCHSVFGLHDPSHSGTPPRGVAYDVVGWYADRAKDALARADAGGAERSVCYARVVFEPESDAERRPAADGESGVFVGSTATEALAAHLGTVLGGHEPDEVENLLEALAFADRLEAKPLDVGAKLTEARHARTFHPLPAGMVWTIQRKDHPDATTDQRQRRERRPLPHWLGDLLNRLNTAQETHDRAVRELAGMRERLFADWHRYQHCAYPTTSATGTRHDLPEPDEVRQYLERSIVRVDEAIALAGEDGLRQVKARVEKALTNYNAQNAQEIAAELVLESLAAPQYYEPGEPVVLLTGDIATPSHRYGRDDTAASGKPQARQVVDVPEPIEPAVLRERVAALGVGGHVWRRAPWHPLLAQWEVEFFPTGPGGNLQPADRNYDATYITGNYTLVADDVELRPRPDTGVGVKGANVYAGTSVVTSATRPILSARLLSYLAGHILEPYAEATNQEMDAERFRQDPGPVLRWYGENGTDQRLRTIVKICRHLREHEHGNLAQALTGLNDALVMRRLGRQLPIGDPLGFPDHQEFAGRVARAVGPETRYTPQPHHDFHPVRAGTLLLRRLRLIDNFGITHDVDTSDQVTTTQLRVPGHPGWVAMPPRLTQPARLTFRWLDSDHDSRQANDVPETSPVCGWIVPDDIDTAVEFYDEQGRALGQLEARAQPGDPRLARWTDGSLARVGNPHLRSVARRMQALGPDHLARLIRSLFGVLDGIEPEQHGDLLAGRPLTVVRAELDLQLMGLPAIHQDWNAFRRDLGRRGRDSNRFTQVRFPVRIGAHGQLNDGLVGLWPDESAPLFLVTEDPGLTFSIGMPPRRLTLLVDPRAPVHVTSGILPTKSISIPPEHYRPVMDNLRLSFFAAPVLADGDRLDLPLPQKPGERWFWRDGAGTPGRPLTEAPADTSFPALPTLREGWLTRRPVPSESERGPA